MNTFEFAKEMGMKLYNGNEFLLKVELMEECPNGYKEIAMVDDFGFPLTLCTDGEDIKAYIDFPEEDEEDDDMEIKVADINIPKEVEVDYVNDNEDYVYICPNCGYEMKPAVRCPECGQLLKVKEKTNMEISYVLKEKLTCGCWSGCFEYFFDKLSTEPTERLRILTAINDFLCKGTEQTKKFICFDYELDNIDSLDEVHMMDDALDTRCYSNAYVAMLDENGNPSLYEIDELREVKREQSMFERILKTVEAKLEVDGYVLENDEIKDLEEQIEWLKEQIRKENN